MVTVFVDQRITMTMEDACLPTPTPFEILTFVGLQGTVEIGAVINSPSFTATYNRDPISAVLTNNDNAEAKDVSASPDAFSSDLSYQKTTPNASVSWTLTADGDAAADGLLWRARIFIGWTTNPGPYVEADILALNELSNPLDGDALFDVTLSPTNGGAGAYLVAAYHDDFNGAVPADFEVGNFGNGDVTEVQSGEPIAIPGGGAPYSIARSDFAVEAPGGIRFARES